MPTYRVIGPQPVHDTLPGNTFTANLPLDQEEFLIAVGHVRKEVVSGPSADHRHPDGATALGVVDELHRHSKPSDADRR